MTKEGPENIEQVALIKALHYIGEQLEGIRDRMGNEKKFPLPDILPPPNFPVLCQCGHLLSMHLIEPPRRCDYFLCGCQGFIEHERIHARGVEK